MNAKETLFKLQKQALTDHHTSFSLIIENMKEDQKNMLDSILELCKPHVTPDELEKMRKRTENKIKQLDKRELPTPFQDPGSYSTVLECWKIIEDIILTINFKQRATEKSHSLKELGLKIVTPHFGTVPMGSVNAATYSCDNEEYLIVFEVELMTFCHLLCKIIAKTFPIYDPSENKNSEYYQEKIIEKINQDPEVVQRFKDLVVAFVTTGRATTAKQYLLDPQYYAFVDHLRLAMEVFIIGHEYAHILLGHVDANYARKDLVMNDISSVIFSWDQESNADFLGLPLMMEGLSKVGYGYSPISYCGAEAFFSAFEILERAKCLIQSGNDEWYWRNCSETGQISDHPSAEMRRNKLRAQMTEIFGPRSIETSQIIEQIIKILWEKIKPGILDSRKDLHIKLLSTKVELSNSRKKYSDALDALETILKLDDKHILALFGKGNILQDLKRFNEADRCYDLILSIDKDNVGALYQKSRVALNREDFATALKLADDALDKDKTNIHALYSKGMALDGLERFDEAIGYFNSILKQDEKNIPSLLRIAFAYTMLTKPQTAIEYYDKILEIDSTNESAITQKFQLLEYLEDYDGILKMLHQFLEEQPNDPELLAMIKEIEQEKEKFMQS